MSLSVTSSRCSFTVAEVQRGIRIEYELAAERDLSVTPLPQDMGGCQEPSLAGLTTFRTITGEGYSFCPQCDLGPCQRRSWPAIVVRAGRYREHVTWNGKTYSGPSDGMSTLASREFPTGSYLLRISVLAAPAGVDAPSRNHGVVAERVQSRVVAVEYRIQVEP